MRNRIRGVVLFVLNHFFAVTRFWRFKNTLLRLVGVKIGSNVKIVCPLKMNVCSNLSIGDNTWIGKNLTILGNEDIEIGKNCDIAPEVVLATGTHEIGSAKRRAGNGYCKRIKIEDGCWIGARAMLLAGVHVKAGSIVAAGAVVTKEVISNVVVGGVPAKVIRELEEIESGD